MNSFKSLKTVFYSMLFLFALSSCSVENDTDTFENSLVTVKLNSTQSDLSQLNIEILDIQLKVSEDESSPNAWISLNALNTGVHDLTDLSQDRSLTMVDFQEVPVGFVHNIKVVLGDENTVMQNGIEYQLNVSSDLQNACANIINKELKANTLYEFSLEIEVDKSVSFSNGDVSLDPKMNTVLRQIQLF